MVNCYVLLVRLRAHLQASFYPYVKSALPERASEVDKDREEHQRIKEVLYGLQGLPPDDPEVDMRLKTLEKDVYQHTESEESSLFPAVRQAVSSRYLRDMVGTFRMIESVAPTRPHPAEPQTAPANYLTAPIAGAIDRLRDAIKEGSGAKTV